MNAIAKVQGERTKEEEKLSFQHGETVFFKKEEQAKFTPLLGEAVKQPLTVLCAREGVVHLMLKGFEETEFPEQAFVRCS